MCGSVAGASMTRPPLRLFMPRRRSGSSIRSQDPEPGYLARVFEEEESAQCQFGTPVIDGDQAAVPWRAQTRLADGGTENLAGVSLLRFSGDGLVLEERDFWNQS
jgi:hypothetical protein